jgi:tRNA modification GTPase
MASTFRAGKVYRDGVSVVIAGEPNVGKSSLFNALLKESRAIVTPVPGTTRDYLEESMLLDGILFKITDTAGIRRSRDPVESEGIARSMLALEHADIVLVDANGEENLERKPPLPFTPKRDQAVILVRNKTDLPGSKRRGGMGANPLIKAEISLSALTGEGVHSLASLLASEAAFAESEAPESVCVMSERHAESLLKGAGSLSTALESLHAGMTNEFVAFDVRECVTALSGITGEVTSEDLLNSIFGRFCIGK